MQIFRTIWEILYGKGVPQKTAQNRKVVEKKMTPAQNVNEVVVTKEEEKPELYFNRELSWLSFNERVLDEAANPRVPLAERLTFASIFQTNLDEFYMVRVGTLMTQMHSKKTIYDTKTGMSSREQFNAIIDKTRILEDRKALVYEQLMGELQPQGITIVNFQKLSEKEGKDLEKYFDNYIAPFLSPTIIGKQNPFPFLSNKVLYAVALLQTGKGKGKIGIVECQNKGVFQRLIEIPTRPGTFMLSEELILHFISKLFSRYTVKEKSIIRLTRNADIDIADVYDEDLDYRDEMEYLIKKRNRLEPVRVELTRELDDHLVGELAKYLKIEKNQFIHVGTPLDLSFVFSLQNYLRERKELFYEPRIPQHSIHANYKADMLEQVEKNDILLSYPYESIKPFIKFLQDASEDPTVVSIKMTLYRVSDKSAIVDALCDAAENGKTVIVLVELRARFDEENNIEVSKRLQEAGCQILYGVEDFKVHSKLCLITRMTPEGGHYLTQIGTGNYNEKTAKLYTDFCLMTANQDIGRDAAKVFDSLQKGELSADYNYLLVAPKALQNKVLDMIDEQIRLGKDGYVGVKINSLTDKVIIEKLIEASQAGVRIEMVIRGICCLRPGVPGYTDNIHIVSIVGRFLEHARIYIFGKGDKQKVYIASADYMTRNTTRRVEVGAPIYDPDIKAHIIRYFNTQFIDDEKGKELHSDGIYYRRQLNTPTVDSQMYFYQAAYDAVERARAEKKHKVHAEQK